MQQSEWGAACHHSGTCALTGSSAFFASIPGSYVMINGPMWCYFYAMKYIDEMISNAGNRFYCTQPSQNSLVYGTEAELLEAFKYMKNNIHADRIFLENNCSVSLVGDDLEGIAAKAELPCPVYTMDSGGLNGSFAGGYEKAFLLAVNHMKKQDRVNRAINILGLSEVYLKGKEDALEIKRLLKKAGIDIIAMPGAGDDWDTILKSPAATLNVVVREELSLKVAQRMEQDFGVPYISIGMPYGIEGTLKWLKCIMDEFKLESGPIEEEAVQRKERMLYRGGNFQSLWGTLWFDNVLISAPPSEAYGIADAIRTEWIDTGKLIIHSMDKSSYIPKSADVVRLAGFDDKEIKRDYENWSGGLLMGSSHERARLLRLNKSFAAFNIARPSREEICVTDLPLCGFRGAEYLYECLWNSKVRNQMKDSI